MQDFLTLAATATLFGTIGFVVFGYIGYVWARTAPAPIAAVAPAPAPAPQVEPVIAAAPIAETTAPEPQAKPVSAGAFVPAKPKRGRPRKVAANTAVVQESQAPKQRRRRVA